MKGCAIFFNHQGRIYVANEYPTYARNMLFDNRKLKISGPIFLNRSESVCFDEKQANCRVKHSLILKHPTVGSQKFNTLHVGW